MRGRIGSAAKRFIDRLIEKEIKYFGVRDATKVSECSDEATIQLLNRLVQAGWVVKLNRGRYAVLPEDGSGLNKLAVGRELARGADYYFAYASAMDVWGMPGEGQTGSPSRVTIAMKDVRWRPRRTVLGTEYQFVKHLELPPRRLTRAGRNRQRPQDWMVRGVEVAPGEWVRVSDLEWTIVSGLGRPDLCGGVEAIAGWMEMHRKDLSIERLMMYARVVSNRTAARRLGYLLEALGMQTEDSALSLSFSVFSSYGRLEPGRPAAGDLCRKWRLDVNAEIGKRI